MPLFDVQVVMTTLWTIAGILLAIWFFGWSTGTTLNGLLHVLLVLAALASVAHLVTRHRSSQR